MQLYKHRRAMRHVPVDTMQIFLSYASEDRELAEEIQLALVGSGHHVFFDKASLPAGGDYHSRIQSAVQSADIFIFLITPNSVAQGSYALTELKYARAKWAHPKEKLVPVLVRATNWKAIPPYLKSVTVLEPEGNIAAEVLTAVDSLNKYRAQPEKPFIPPSPPPKSTHNEGRNWKSGGMHTIYILASIISLAGAFCAFLIFNWSNLFPPNPPPTSDAGPSPPGPSDCPQITITDYSKFPPESRIVPSCNP